MPVERLCQSTRAKLELSKAALPFSGLSSWNLKQVALGKCDRWGKGVIGHVLYATSLAEEKQQDTNC